MWRVIPSPPPALTGELASAGRARSRSPGAPFVDRVIRGEKKHHRASIAVFLAATFALSGCSTVVRERVVVREPAPVVIRHMPAPRQEVLIAQPGPGYAWVQGHWAWQGNHWQWQAGHWHHGAVRRMPELLVESVGVAPSPNHYWVPGHWHWQTNDWVWARGHWAY